MKDTPPVNLDINICKFLTEGVDEALSKKVETSGAQSLTQRD